MSGSVQTYPSPEEMKAEGYTGLQKVRRAIALDGGYGWCREHRSAPKDCLGLHPEPEHLYWCQYPDQECECR